VKILPKFASGMQPDLPHHAREVFQAGGFIKGAARQRGGVRFGGHAAHLIAAGSLGNRIYGFKPLCSSQLDSPKLTHAPQ
jgi:hypothetical protein